MRQSVWFAGLLLVAIGLAGCGTSAVEEAEKRWQASGVDDYRIQVRETHSIWCYYEVSLEVRDGQVVTGTITAYPGPAQDCGAYTKGVVREALGLSPEDAARWTVPGLFQEAYRWATWADRPDMRVELEFDPDLGYPHRMLHDNKVAVDDDGGVSVIQFERLGP